MVAAAESSAPSYDRCGGRASEQMVPRLMEGARALLMSFKGKLARIEIISDLALAERV